MPRRHRKPPVPQQAVEITIDSQAHDGRGVGRINGKAVFVEGALLGEKVVMQYTRCHGKFDEARAIEILESSPDRVTPQCSAAAVCGGCSLQHMRSDAQIAMKHKILQDQLAHFGDLSPKEWLAPMTGPTFGYRRKARLGAKYVEKKGRALVGFREKNSGFLAEIEQCHVLVPEVGLAFPELRQLIESLQQRLNIPQIEVAQGDDATALVVRHMQPLPPADQEALVRFCQQRQFHLYLQPAGPDSIHKV
ncbi:MAG TPA: TRAM domain-containing protein, partial [Dongiaceae bacterium]|nr:TRAM domain-containing protein [Dongiaceae bacterium]